MRAFLRALNPPVYSVAIVPVFVAAAAAWQATGQLSVARFFLTLVGLIIVQVGINLQNDYFDAKTGVDETKEESFVRVWNSPRPVLIAFSVAFTVAIGIFIYLQATLGGVGLLAIVLTGGLLGFFYSAPPLRLSYRGLGELTTFLCFGPLAVLGAYYVQTQEISLQPFLLSIPVGFLTVAILYIHYFPQEETDRQHGKRTFVVRLGRRRAARFFPLFISVPYLFVVVLAATGSLPIDTLLFLATVPLAVRISLQMAESIGRPGLVASKYSAMALHFAGGLTLSVGLLADRWLAG